MKLQDLDALRDGQNLVVSASSFAVLNEAGQALFTLKLRADGSLEVRAGQPAKLNGQLLDDKVVVAPLASDGVAVLRLPATE
ncbi:hypothetical protein BUE93_21995 [Chromobacterium amazonense]|uniref:Uncharacterized protein n=1 Tax=Chromobacterium amazonense TaxID=1382803 RepID=A0A2S9WYD5_9NEIS|nr:hypothetical protein [Chromobacterium amazonense]PRP68477.1 hypothetical protein BUE93_21995 [Chromobacterium amazonense]